MDIADEEVDSGADLLVAADMGIGNTTPAAVLDRCAGRCGRAAVTGRGTGIDDRAWMRKCAAVRDAHAAHAGRSSETRVRVLATGAGADIAAMAGFLGRRPPAARPVLLDGVVSGAAALLAQRVSYRAVDWWQAGHLSTEPAHRLALGRLALDPLLEHGLRLGEGTGALLALPLLRAPQATLAEMATFAEAGVSGALPGADPGVSSVSAAPAEAP